MKAVDISGQRFGRLVAVDYSVRKMSGHSVAYWRCICDCGTEHYSRGTVLRRGEAHSCGCLTKEMQSRKAKTHGLAKTRLYRIWGNIISRCTNENTPNYKKYGARGISICDEWRNSFIAFAKSVGEPPTPSHSIDRIDGYGNYEPGNVRWATPIEQGRNRRNVVEVEYCGQKMCLAEAAEVSGINYSALIRRVRSGWPIEKALLAPARKKLTETDIRNIRDDRRSPRDIAAEYGVHRQTIADVKSGKSWKGII